MPVMVIPEIGIICPGLGTVEMDPEKFPWIFIRTDVGVFPRTVEKKQSPACAVDEIIPPSDNGSR